MLTVNQFKIYVILFDVDYNSEVSMCLMVFTSGCSPVERFSCACVPVAYAQQGINFSKFYTRFEYLSKYKLNPTEH